MTYRDLLARLKQLSKSQLEQSVEFYNPYDRKGQLIEIGILWIANDEAQRDLDNEARRDLGDIRTGQVLLAE